ncbi:uncharacterized protein TRIADDRAFT_61949 [Trichoplax adhaerens]|uniref:Uncharacterized protein n=1 Tax=Trichoplax adhaerens TaxID=10228 RepID=B3SCF0_TRIAD|nr:predicted protein [Trichoplax adhaerens]EDV19581.1 predicted protein [Trichoplax adhaerens]|eukprot:XP_002117914.1 predicted protein [Trichoplax adhaerens]
MVFTTHNQEIHVKTDFNSLQFCPSIHLTSFIMTLSRNRHEFRPILPNIQFVRDILVSDHQFICIDYYREVHVLKIIGDQVQSYEKVNPSFFNKATLIPGSSRLLVYDYEEKHCIYEYNLQASVEILDVGLAYINNIPIIALLTNDADNVCKLQVSDYKSETSPRLFYHSLQNHNERCFLYNDLKSAIVVCIKKEEHRITVTKIDRILGRDDGSLHKELLDYALPEEYPNYYFVQTRFRKVDKTLICIIKSWDENYGWGMLIITISVETREKMAYQQDHRYQDLNQIYADDFYLYTWQKEKDGYESNHAYSVQCYKFGDSKHQTQLVQVIPCDHWEGIVCKINLSSSGMTYDSQIKHSTLNMPREQLNECWREEDANVIKMFERQEKEIFLLENGNHRAVREL